MRLKRILLITAAVPAALAASVVAILASTDIAAYRSLLAEEVKTATGRDLSLGGGIRLSVSLRPTIVIEDVAFANAPWGSRPQMLTVRRLEAQVALLPLLQGEIRVERLLLVGPDVLLETDADGRGNWMLAGLGPGSGGGAPPDAAGAAVLPQVARLSIRDARLTIRGGASDAAHAVVLRRLDARPSDAAGWMSVAVDGAFDAVPITLNGRVGTLRRLVLGDAYPVDLAGTIADLRFAVEGEVPGPETGREPMLALSLAGDSLADLETLLGWEPPPIGPYSLAARLRWSADAVRLESLLARLGQSNLTGDLAVTWSGPRPSVEGVLASSFLDLTPFAEGSGAPTPDTAGGRVFSAAPLPFDALRRVDARLRLVGQRLRWRSVLLDEFRLDALLADGRLQVDGFEAGWGDGWLQATAAADSGGPAPALDLRLTGRHIGTGALLQTLGIGGLSGAPADLELELRGQGDSPRTIMAGLDGVVRLEVESGHIDGPFAEVDLADSIGLIDRDEAGPNLNCAAGRFEIDGGLAVSRGLVLDTNSAIVLGEGQIDLETEALNVRLRPHGKGLGLMSFGTSLSVGGSLAEPTVAADPTPLVLSAAAVLATGATGGLAAAVLAMAAGGAAAGLTANESGTTGGERCAELLAALDAETDRAPSGRAEPGNRR